MAGRTETASRKGTEVLASLDSLSVAVLDEMSDEELRLFIASCEHWHDLAVYRREKRERADT